MNRLLTVAAVAGGLWGAAFLSGSALASLTGEAGNTAEYHASERMLVTTQSWPFAAGGIADIDVCNGGITVTGWDQPTAQLVVTRRLEASQGWLGWFSGARLSEDKVREHLELVRVEATVAENSLRVRSIPGTENIKPRVQTQIELRVPRATALRLAADNGKVDVSDIASAITATADNGAIDIEKITGAVRAHSGNGRLQLTGIDGDVHADTGNGAISCDGVNGAVELNSDNGAIDARGASGKGLSCRTGNGAIEVRVASTQGLNVDLSTGSGSVRCDAPLDNASGQSVQAVRGTVRGGGPMIALRSGNGAVTLVQE